MKNRLFALLLVVALVITVSVFAVGAETTEPETPVYTLFAEGGIVTAPCQHCKGADCQWAPIPTTPGSIDTWADGNGTYLSQGYTHFYLTGATTLNKMIVVPEKTTYCFELNGQTWTAEGAIYFFQAYNGGGIINIMDRSQNGTGVMDLPSTSSSVRHVYMDNTGVINQYGGKMTRLTEGNAIVGACMYKVGGTYNMYGGSMHAKTGGDGGAVWQNEGTFNLMGGTITSENTAAKSGGAIYIKGGSTLNVEKGSITATNKGSGGAIYMTGASKMTMSGGTINGTAAWDGGAIYMAGASTLTISGGTITGASTGTSWQSNGSTVWFNGGGISANGKSKITMTGGEITGCSAKGRGGAICLNDSEAEITGGKIYKNTAVNNGDNIMIASGKLVFGGNAQIGHDTEIQETGLRGPAIFADSSATIDITGGTIKNFRTTGSGGAIHTNSASVSITMTDGLIENCHAVNGGFLGLTTGTPTTISGGIIRNCTATKLGGAIANYTSYAASITLKDNVQILNCSAMQGGAVAMNVASGTLTMEGGKIDSCFATRDGGGVYIMNNATFNMKGGSMLDCTTTKTNTGTDIARPFDTAYDATNAEKNPNVGKGGAVMVEMGTFNMEGGTISGGEASYGGAIAVGSHTASGIAKISGGVIEDCYANVYGGAIAVYGGKYWKEESEGYTQKNYDNKGKLEIDGCEIKNCHTGNNLGGGIYVGANVSITAEDLTIEKCYVGGNTSGGNLYIESNTAPNLTFTNCTFIGSGDAEAPQAGYGGNVFVNNANVTFDTCEFTDGVARYNGGNLYVNGSSANVTVTGNSTFSGGKAGSRGGNIGVYLGKLTLTGDTNVSGKDTSSVYMGTNVTVFGTGAALTLNGNVVIEDAPLHENTEGELYYQTWSVAIEPGCTVTVGGNVNVDDIVMRHADDGAGALMDDAMTIQSDFTGTIYVNLYLATHMEGHEPGAEIGAWLAQDGYENTGIIGIYNEKWTKFFLVDTGDKFVVAPFTGIKNGVEYGLTDLSNTGSYDYIKLYTGGEISLTDNTTVLLNGQTAHFITNTKKLSVIDTKTDLFNAAGTTFTVEDVNDLVMTAQNNGNQYVVVGNEEDGFTSNRVQVKITGLAVRPTAVGIYYVTTIRANAGVKDYIKTFGTALTIVDEVEIKENFDETDGILYTQIDGDQLNLDAEGKATTNSVLIEGILDENASVAENAEWSAMPIKAASYIEIDTMNNDEEVVRIMGENVVDESLDTAMKLMDAQYEKLGAKQEAALGFYTTWLSRGGFANVQLPNLEDAAAA